MFRRCCSVAWWFRFIVGWRGGVLRSSVRWFVVVFRSLEHAPDVLRCFGKVRKCWFFGWWEDLASQARVAEVNAGFYLVHCNSRTLQFWERVLAEEIAYPKMDGFPPYTDQYHVNRGLHYCHGEFPQRGHFGVRWSTIPDRHCVWSDLESWDEARLAAFHHAVNTQNKPELLRRVRNAVLAVQDVGEVVNRELMPMVRTSFSTKQLEEEAWRLASQASVQLTGEVCASCNGWVSSWWLLCWSAVDGKGFCCRCSDIWRAERATTDAQVSVRFFGSWSS